MASGDLRPYVVRDGDYLARIASRIGCPPDEIWTDPQNAALASSRDPNQLAPGDVLWIPEARVGWLPVEVGAQNTFVGRLLASSVHLFFGPPDAPFASEACTVTGSLDDATTTATEADGSLQLRVGVDVDTIRVAFSGRDVEYLIAIGRMDPIDTRAGVRKRLHNLGHCEADRDATEGALRLAIAGFQSEQGLPLSGELDSETRAALLKAHGS